MFYKIDSVLELPLTKVRRLDLLRPQIVLHRQLPKTSVFGLTSSPRASHPVVPTVGRFLFRQIQYIMIFFKRQYFFFSPKGVSRFAQAANRPLPEERGLTATLDKGLFATTLLKIVLLFLYSMMLL